MIKAIVKALNSVEPTSSFFYLYRQVDFIHY